MGTEKGKVSQNLYHVIRKILYFFFSSQKYKVIAMVTLVIFFGVVPSIDSILLRNLTEIIEGTGGGSIASDITKDLFLFAVIYALWFESLNLSQRLYDYIYLRAMPKIKAHVIDDFYNLIQYHSNDFFQENMTGEITSRISDGARAADMVYYYFTEKILKKLAMIIFALITLYSVHHVVGHVFLVWLILFLGISVFFSNKINRLSTNFNKKRAVVSGRIVDSISNISVIRMFTSHGYERKYLGRYLDDFVDSDRAMQWFMLKLRYVLGLITSTMMFCLIYYVVNLKSQNLITIGDCVLIISLCISLIDQIWDITQELGDMFEQIGSFSLALTLAEQDVIADAKDAKDLVVKNADIEFRGVTFKYKHNENIFSNKNVYISAQQKIGLVGFSGSGKSTFTKLIARLHDIDGGMILIDGQDIKQVRQDSLRQHISIIPQEPILFHRTILENIKYGNESATMDQVIAAAKAAYIHDVIEAMPEGYDSLCGERGNNLSIGQKQRIIIARAILKNAPILILDEATSALDSHTEQLIQKSLKNLMEGKTVLIIAHRLSTLLDMDRILVFENGNIVEDGTHKSLKSNGKVYQQLWETQSKGVI